MRVKLSYFLKIKPGEVPLVKQLFLVQFLIGIGTAFLFTSSITLFLSTFTSYMLPQVYIIAAGLLILSNIGYAYLEHRLTSKDLLQTIILFSMGSLVLSWLVLSLFSNPGLVLFLAAWNFVVYMIVGYAFWGMAAILFNVRESKRLFSVVGSGDIPAKMLGYLSVSLLVPYMGITNILWVSIIAFGAACYFLRSFNHPALTVSHTDHDHHSPHHHPDPSHVVQTQYQILIDRYFHNSLIFSIAVWSVVGGILFALIDFTFLAEIKTKYQGSEELASFIAIFFAVGRLLALIIKLVLSNRIISRLGLTRSLLITPLLLLPIAIYIILVGEYLNTHLYTFGFMVMVAEVLKSSLQEPVFFVLFQPLSPSDRLRGHLIAKGYTLPIALFAVGAGLMTYLHFRGSISILYVSELVLLLILCWIGSVFMINTHYLKALVNAIKKGHFTGTELFLNDKPVRDLLLSKTASTNPKEVIHALNLLEHSKFKDLNSLLLRHLSNPSAEVRKYVLSRITTRHMREALPLVEQQLATLNEQDTAYLRPDLIRAFYVFKPEISPDDIAQLPAFDPPTQKAALLGLMLRKETTSFQIVRDIVSRLASGSAISDRILSAELILELGDVRFTDILKELLQDPDPRVFKKTIEACGKIKALDLLPDLLSVAIRQKAQAAFQRALIYYGEDVYSQNLFQDRTLPEFITLSLIKTAGKLTDGPSTEYLLAHIRDDNSTLSDTAIEALWSKNISLSPGGEKEVAQWLNKKLHQSKIKVSYFPELDLHPGSEALKEALLSEIRHDLQVLLKALAMLYHRSRVERVIELVRMENKARLSLAIEMLELVIPKKYFIRIDVLMEFLQDQDTGHIRPLPLKRQGITSILTQIMTEKKVGCSPWTQAVACYIIPEVAPADFPLNLLEQKTSPDNALISETRLFVLTKLKSGLPDAIN